MLYKELTITSPDGLKADLRLFSYRSRANSALRFSLKVKTAR